MVTTTAMIIIAACGVGLAVFYTYFIKKVLGGFLRDLSEKNAQSEDSALSLASLGYGKIRAVSIYAFLSENSVLRRFVGVCVKEKESIATQKYYLFPEKKEDALNRYKDNGQSLKALIICVVALIIAAVVFITAAPYVEDFIDGIPNSFNNEKPHIEGAVDDGIEMITPEDIQKKYEEELKKQQEEAEKNKQLEEAFGESGDSSAETDKDTDTKE